MTMQEPLPIQHPKLPNGISVAVLLIIVSQASVLLVNQPAAYWIYPQQASKTLPLPFLLTGGPVAFALGVVFYLLATGLVLKRLVARLAYPLAGGLFLIHSFWLYASMPCGLLPFESSYSYGCEVPAYGANVIVAILLFVALFGVYPNRWTRWLTRIAISLTAAWFILLGISLYQVIFPAESAWKLIVPAHSPGPRSKAAIAYDTRRNRAVLFGGLAEWKAYDTIYDSSTWEWDGADWHEIKTVVAPPARYLHSMAYDEERGTVILYGGRNKQGALADLWEWDGERWTQLCPTCNPAKRFNHKMFYDIAREQIIIYGGQNNGIGYSEAWMWNGCAWGNFQFSTGAPGFFGSNLVYDRQNQRVVGFVNDPDWGGTWIWEGDRWFQPDLSFQPILRVDPALVYDPDSGDIIMFGGGQDGNDWESYQLNDTWRFDGESWEQLKMPLSPPGRYGSMAFYDAVRQSIVIYGGEKNYHTYSDMWELVMPGGN